MDDKFHRGIIIVEQQHLVLAGLFGLGPSARGKACLLYTSDAADERSRVDLGGRRIIKKKQKEE